VVSKQVLIYFVKIHLQVFLILFVFACNHTNTQSSNAAKEIEVETSDRSNRDSTLVSLTRQVLALIKNEDFDQLSQFFHPVLGVRLSPYGYIDTANHVRITAEEFLKKLKGKEVVKWGNYDGSGKEIMLTPQEYFRKFVYDVDFLHAEQIRVNEILGTGNTLSNLETVYNGSDYVENYFSGFDKKYEGMAWRSLRLVFQLYEGKNYLVAIVHDQWTI